MNKSNPELIKETKNNPNSWVHVLDKEFEGKQEITAGNNGNRCTSH